MLLYWCFCRPRHGRRSRGRFSFSVVADVAVAVADVAVAIAVAVVAVAVVGHRQLSEPSCCIVHVLFFPFCLDSCCCSCWC